MTAVQGWKRPMPVGPLPRAVRVAVPAGVVPQQCGRAGLVAGGVGDRLGLARGADRRSRETVGGQDVARIQAGLAKFYGEPFTAEVAGNTFERRPGVRTWPTSDVLRTLHTTASKALLVPAGGPGTRTRPRWRR